MRKNTHKAVNYLQKLVAFDTVSRNSNMALIRFVAGELATLGIESDLITDDTGAKANLFATLGGPRDVPGIVLSGHTDVVPVDGQDWITDPFQVIEKEGKLYGRGTADMKSFLAICLALAPAIKAAPLREPVHIAFSYDEEVGCRGVVRMIDKIRNRHPRPRACIVGEPTSMRVVNAHKGISAFQTEIRGREAHSSETDFGESAIFAATRLIEFLRGLLNEMRERGDPSGRFEPAYTSINVGTLNGGSALNIIPNHCRFEWEYRTLPGVDEDEIINRFNVFANDEVLPAMQANFPQASIVTTDIARAPALVPQSGCPAEELVQALTGQNDTHAVAYVTEGGLFQNADIPTVICGPGDIKQAHRPNEFIELSQVEAGTAFMEKLVQSLSA